MKPLIRRLSKLEERYTAKQDQRQLRLAAILRERRCRRLAAKRNMPYEDVLREELAKSERFWQNYRGDGSVFSVLRYSRQFRLVSDNVN